MKASSIPSFNKLPLKTQILSYQQLSARVTQWVAKFHLHSFRYKYHLKPFPAFLQQLPPQITIKSVIYSIVKRLPGLLWDKDQDVSELSNSIKQYYSMMNLKVVGKKEKDNNFYFLCIFLTKITMYFLENCFLNLDVDLHLESQVYITLVHAMLGIQVCPKSYQINLKKFVVLETSRSKIHKNTFFSHCQSVPSLSSRKKMKKGKTLHPIHKLLVKLTIQRKGTLDYKEDSNLQDFKAVLKQNLNIKSLPKLPPKLIKASQFDVITDLNEAGKEGDQKSFIFSRKENRPEKPICDYLKSTQNSSSFELMLKKNNQIPPSINKTVKISHRPQLMPNKRSHLSMKINSEKVEEEGEDMFKKCDTGRKNWSKIVQKIKQHVTITSKHQFKSRLCQNMNQGIDFSFDSIKQTNCDQKQCQKENIEEQVKLRGLKSDKSQKSDQQVPKSGQFFSYWLQNPKPLKRQAEPCKTSSHHFRKLKKQFEYDCEQRDQNSKYSIFNLNNPTSSMRRQ